MLMLHKLDCVDVDVCRAVVAAVLGDANKVKFTPPSAKEIYCFNFWRD